MPLIAPKSTSSHPPAPDGMHVARCYSMIDLGTHERTGNYGTKRERKLRLIFELPHETYVFNEQKGEQPFSVHRDFTFSMHEKAALRKFLNVWRGKNFTDEEAFAFDVAKLLGAPAYLSIVHADKGDRLYANIASANKLPKGMECPPIVNERTEFSLADFNEDVFESFPEWLQQEIASSDEFKAMKNTPPAKAEYVSASEEDDDIPF